MFDIGFPELLLVAIVALLVLGPERLPQALRTLGLWLGRLRRSFNAMKHEIEREIGMDEVRRQLHNEAVMDELKRIERDVRTTLDAPAERPPAPLDEPAATSSAEDASAARPAAAAGATSAGTPQPALAVVTDASEEPLPKPGAINHG